MTETETETEKILIHVRVDVDDVRQLDELKTRLHFGSRSTAVSVGMPALLAFLEKMCETREDATKP